MSRKFVTPKYIDNAHKTLEEAREFNISFTKIVKKTYDEISWDLNVAKRNSKQYFEIQKNGKMIFVPILIKGKDIQCNCEICEFLKLSEEDFMFLNLASTSSNCVSEWSQHPSQYANMEFNKIMDIVRDKVKSYLQYKK